MYISLVKNVDFLEARAIFRIKEYNMQFRVDQNVKVKVYKNIINSYKQFCKRMESSKLFRFNNIFVTVYYTGI